MTKPKFVPNPPSWKLGDYPVATAYTAGFLTTKNAGWRSERPVINAEKCVGCLQCYLHCPDGTIRKAEDKVAVDYDYCKGCGICAKICKFGAVGMEREEQ